MVARHSPKRTGRLVAVVRDSEKSVAVLLGIPSLTNLSAPRKAPFVGRAILPAAAFSKAARHVRERLQLGTS
jgi:hypothetical protein